MKKNPAVSVIVPMYNSEKYIGECLNRLLEQTFQDFEVIVVDDCSTDNSVAVVKSYAPKFGERLTLTKTKSNSGGGGYVPRNVGLKLSRGEFIFFVDADDFIVETALEILHEAARGCNADVVYTSMYYSYNDNGKMDFFMDTETKRTTEKGLENKMILTTDDPNENLKRLLIDNAIFHMPWTKFVKRSLLVENKIEFPKIISGGDFIWSIQVVCYTKRFLRLPIALYFYRQNSSSVTQKKRSAEEQIVACFSAFLSGAEALYALSNKIALLKQNPNYLRAALTPFLDNCLGRTLKTRIQLSTPDFYDILYREFAKGNNSSNLTLSFLISTIDLQQKQLLAFQQRIIELENALKNKE